MTEGKASEIFLDKFIRQTDLDEKGCLIWRGHIHSSGYPRVTYRGRSWFVHRLGWTLCKGTIPDRHVILHLCDNKMCVNINHLLPGTQADNIKDMVEKGRHYRIHKTLGVCRRGHKMTHENTYVRKCGYTYCRECIKITKQKNKKESI